MDKQDVKSIQSAVESMLFASGEPVSVEKISDVLDIDKKLVKKVMETIIDRFEVSESGIQIVCVDNEYQMCSKSENADFIRELLDVRRKMPLSSAAMEVLAIIAYNQPITKAFVEQVRGVDSSSIVNNLCQKGLIEEKGRL